MTTVTIFGSGNMGTAIDGVLSAGGAQVEHIGSADTNATVAGDIVILAVPYPALEGIVANYGPQLAGKTVVDISNPAGDETDAKTALAVAISARGVDAVDAGP